MEQQNYNLQQQGQTFNPLNPPPQPLQPQSSSETGRTVLTIVLLIFLAPIGVIAMWAITRWPKWVKAVVTAMIIIPVIALLGLIVSMRNYFTQRIEYTQNSDNSIADMPLPPSVVPGTSNKLKAIKRDAKIQEDIMEWRTAIELYKAYNGIYPTCPLQKPTCYIKELNLSERDLSLNLKDNADYLFWSDEQNYKIQFDLEQKEQGKGPTYKGINCATSQGLSHGACLTQ